jgi:hypothetical protein
VTDRDRAQRAAAPLRPPRETGNAQAARSRVAGAWSRVTRCARDIGHAVVGDVRAARSPEQPLWATSPASLADLRAYIHSADWVPGDELLLEVAGRAYGYLVAIPLSAALYAVAWVIQRPGRFALACAVALVVWLTI